MFRRLALPALAVLLWCVARAPNPPPTYELPLELLAEDVRDPGPDPDVPLVPGFGIADSLPELDRIDHLTKTESIEREWFDEPRPAITVPRDPLFAEWEPDEQVRYGFPSPYSNRAFPLNRRALERAGGDSTSMRATARGLAWLARQQHRDGGWACDGSDADDRIAATALALLAFLAHGETHAEWPLDSRPGLRGSIGSDSSARTRLAGTKYQKPVWMGFDFLVQQFAPDGSFRGAKSLTALALATFALCEAHAMTGTEWLARPARFARAALLRAQRYGRWPDVVGGVPDEFATGWAREALALGPCPGAWSTRNDARRAELPAAQRLEEGKWYGSWEPAGGFGERFGRLGTTALNLLALAAPYRYSPSVVP